MNVLVVLARVPVPGSGKTRLRAQLGDDAVDLLAGAFVADIMGWSRDATDTVLVAHDGPAAGLPHSGDGAMLVAQVDGDLGARITAAVDEAFRRGAARAVIIGSDCPTLPGHLVAACFDGLASHGSTVVPADDGGWIALGVDRPLNGALRDVVWSTAQTGEQTIAALEADGRTPLVLESWYDVDEAGDLRRVRGDVALHTRAPRTDAVLAGLGAAVR